MSTQAVWDGILVYRRSDSCFAGKLVALRADWDLAIRVQRLGYGKLGSSFRALPLSLLYHSEVSMSLSRGFTYAMVKTRRMERRRELSSQGSTRHRTAPRAEKRRLGLVGRAVAHQRWGPQVSGPLSGKC